MAKPRQSYGKNASGKDRCYTPPYGVGMLIPFLPKGVTIWESACGGNYIAWALLDYGFDVVATDKESTGTDYFAFEPDAYDVQVTNPPYQAETKRDWIERAYLLGKPFALLMQGDTMFTKGVGQLFDQYGVEILVPSERIDFFMPHKGYTEGGARFKTCWFTWGLQIGKALTYVEISKPDRFEVLASVERLAKKYGRSPINRQVQPSPTLIKDSGKLWQQRTLFQSDVNGRSYAL